MSKAYSHIFTSMAAAFASHTSSGFPMIFWGLTAVCFAISGMISVWGRKV